MDKCRLQHGKSYCSPLKYEYPMTFPKNSSGVAFYGDFLFTSWRFKSKNHVFLVTKQDGMKTYQG